jgi:hypothetical protein
VTQHAVLDPVVGDAVRSIGYDTLLRDACRVLQAIKLKDASPCTAITASALQERCAALVAMATQDPDKCPWYATAEKELGRDPTCLAIASHDPRTCAAASSTTTATCEALASGDGARCAKATGDELATCTRDFTRQRALLAVERDAHDATTPKARVDIHGADGGKDPAATNVDLSANVLGGAVVSSAASDGVHIELARDLETTLKLASRGDRSHLTASIVLGSNGPTVSALALGLPKLPELTCEHARCAMTVTVSKADPRRGAPIAVTIAGKMQSREGGSYDVQLQIDTFVRDVVSRAAVYGGR